MNNKYKFNKSYYLNIVQSVFMRSACDITRYGCIHFRFRILRNRYAVTIVFPNEWHNPSQYVFRIDGIYNDACRIGKFKCFMGGLSWLNAIIEHKRTIAKTRNATVIFLNSEF